MKKNNTNKGLHLVALVIAFLSITFIIFKAANSNKPVYSEIVVIENGYGYTIKSDHKILIKQDFIPAIQGEKPFLSKDDAKLVSELVVNRILKKQSPIISLEDLQHLNITLANNE